MKMKKLLSIFVCISMTLLAASCGGGGTKATKDVAVIGPDTLITAEAASSAAGVKLGMTEDSVVNDGSARSVTYVPQTLGAADPVSVRIEQFSDSLTTTQVWNDYENTRVHRSDMEFVSGIGEDCYIAYPFIHVYDRGCYIRISAGSGNSEGQKKMLISLAKQAVTVLEANVSAEAAEDAAGNIIK